MDDHRHANSSGSSNRKEMAEISHISISGPALASLLHLLSSSPSDCHGLLFGHLSSPPPPSLHDDGEDGHGDASAPSISLTSVLSLSSPSSLSSLSFLLRPELSPVGWFSARRSSPLRPSMRERSLTSTLSRLSSAPFVFLLLTSSSSPNLALHTHHYRAYYLLPSGVLRPVSITVSNLGPSFRSHYGAFAPDSALPWVPCGRGAPSSAESAAVVEELAAGFGIDRLRKMAGDEACGYARELEDLYGKMLGSLETLTREVEESDAKVGEQESKNMKLRSKLAKLARVE